jgi:predicted transcriptional regulator
MTKKKGIIYETLGSTAQMRVVESGNDGEMLLHGVFGVCGIKNGNNRIYEKSNYGKMVNILQEQMKSEAVLGELEHPNTMNITLENVSHKIEEIQMNEDGTVTGTIRLLDTPKGKIAKAIIAGGCPLYISSRGAGNIDESGHVTLTMLKTYDLVGTPGFSQAKLTLKQGQKFEALNESLDNPAWMIIEGEDTGDADLDKELNGGGTDNGTDKKTAPKPDTAKVVNQDSNKDNKNGINADNKITMVDIKNSIDELTEKVSKLESELHIAQEALDTANEALCEVQKKEKINYAGVQAWIEEEFAPELQRSINEHVQNNIINWVNESYSPQLEKWLSTEYADKIQSWVTDEFAPVMEKWVNTEYADTLQEWLNTEYANTLQNWIAEEYSGAVHKWITEEFTPELNQNISDFLESHQNDDRYSAIDDVLEKLANSVDNEKAAQEILESQQKTKYAGIPVVEGMPMNYRPMWEALSDEKKDQIIRESRMYNMSEPKAVENFWSTRQLTTDTVTESRQTTPVSTGTPMSNSRANMFATMIKLRQV